MVVALIIAIPVMSFITGYFTLKAYKTGLTHNWETKNNMKPSEQPNIIEKVIVQNQEVKQQNRVQNILDEWLNGEQEG